MDFLSKLIFYFKKPQIIIVAGRGRSCAAEAIFQVLRQHFKVGRLTNSPRSLNFGQILSKDYNPPSTLPAKSGAPILIFETDFEIDLKNQKKFEFLIKNSSLPILIVTNISDIPPDRDFFAGEREKTTEIRKLARILPSQGYLILNFDDETVREIKGESRAHSLTFGFQGGADFKASDVRLNNGTNFKINYKGNIVPIWLEKLFGKEQIYASLSAVSIGVIFDLNLVEISQLLKNYQGFVGKRNGT